MEVQEVKFYTMNEVLAKVGGIITIITKVMMLFFTYWLYRQLVQAISEQIYEEDVTDSQDKEKWLKAIQRKFETRLSFLGLYRLFDAVEELKER